jgi:hypothetical protein
LLHSSSSGYRWANNDSLDTQVVSALHYENQEVKYVFYNTYRKEYYGLDSSLCPKILAYVQETSSKNLPSKPILVEDHDGNAKTDGYIVCSPIKSPAFAISVSNGVKKFINNKICPYKNNPRAIKEAEKFTNEAHMHQNLKANL